MTSCLGITVVCFVPGLQRKDRGFWLERLPALLEVGCLHQSSDICSFDCSFHRCVHRAPFLSVCIAHTGAGCTAPVYATVRFVLRR